MGRVESCSAHQKSSISYRLEGIPFHAAHRVETFRVIPASAAPGASGPKPALTGAGMGTYRRAMEFECRACGTKANYEPKDQHREALPGGWRMHDVEGHKLLLCGPCGHPGNFVDGLSPHIRQRLRARGVALEEPRERHKGRPGIDWGEVEIGHDGGRYKGTFVVEEGMLTLTHVTADGGVLRKSAHVGGMGEKRLALTLLGELIVPESERGKK